MKRAYYSDPLAAAWMAKHFGVITQWLCSEMHNTTHADYADAYMNDADDVKYYIHPDSLSILEPIVGDYIRENNSHHDVFLVDDYGYGKSCTLLEAEAWVSEGHTIIQRNNQPFHWPEFEV